MTTSGAGRAISVAGYKNGILAGNVIILSQAITLCESSLPQDKLIAAELIESILPNSGSSIRVGITGAPGVGKSTFIETFGKYLTSLGKRIAILTIDPTSQRTRGSILGDKTRMDELSKDILAFIRPTASGATLGGVGSATREAILLCEAAGFEIVIVETVGVGQSEIAVRSMVDFFLLLMLAGAGDELQGIKKGITEMADAIMITKADGDNVSKATQARAEFTNALHLFQSPASGSQPRVLTSSALENRGITDAWQTIEQFISETRANGFFAQQRNNQKLDWFFSSIDEMLRTKMTHRSNNDTGTFQKNILDGNISPPHAARKIIEAMFSKGA